MTNILVLSYRENLLNVSVLFDINVVFSNNVKESLIRNSLYPQKGCVCNIPLRSVISLTLVILVRFLALGLNTIKIVLGIIKNLMQYLSTLEIFIIKLTGAVLVITYNNSVIDRNIVESPLIKHGRNINMNQNAG